LNLRKWFGLRGLSYVGRRAAILLSRYGLTPGRAIRRVKDSTTALAGFGCVPTFPTPGRIVERYPRFIRELQDAGAEIAVHGYDHVDLTTYAPAKASEQLSRASRAFRQHGIQVHGFRCPYLSCTDGLLAELPAGAFGYSSNRAVWWDVVPPTEAQDATVIFHALDRFYKPASADDVVCVPWMRAQVVEIPVSLPDDLQLHDGLHLDPEGMTQAWSRILQRTHQRGELFVLQFHPELAWRCLQPLEAVLREAACLRPPVWVARLQDVADWWQEKSALAITVSEDSGRLHITFASSERATILVRGLSDQEAEPKWHGPYRRLRGRELVTAAEPRPFVGLPSGASEHVLSFLRDQGYILEVGDTAPRCAIYLDLDTLARLTSEVALIDNIEAQPGPMVRYWRWPDGAGSALCISGDLDALTLLDYVSRLFAR
jgi:hypothetical protein